LRTIDTVVEEKPLSFATSRMVTIATLAPNREAHLFDQLRFVCRLTVAA
jgi:hypothetical protein